MAAQILLVTEVFPLEGKTAAVGAAWAAQAAPAGSKGRAVYQALDQSSCLELIALDQDADLALIASLTQRNWSLLGADLQGDLRTEVLRFVEAPKDSAGPLPATPFIQLRHVEVKPPAHSDYLAWRARTIFNVVRNAPEVETFLAYHSLVSAEPGVMFVSGFSCDVEQYGKVFSTEAYRQIGVEAAAHYITGGERGLYTKFYRAL